MKSISTMSVGALLLTVAACYGSERIVYIENKSGFPVYGGLYAFDGNTIVGRASAAQMGKELQNNSCRAIQFQNPQRRKIKLIFATDTSARNRVVALRSKVGNNEDADKYVAAFEIKNTRKTNYYRINRANSTSGLQIKTTLDLACRSDIENAGDIARD